MFSRDYQALAYDTHLFYEGHSDDLIEKAREKLRFEQERFLNTTNPAHLDTFEKFLDLSENDDPIKTPKGAATNSAYAFEGGSPLTLSY